MKWETEYTSRDVIQVFKTSYHTLRHAKHLSDALTDLEPTISLGARVFIYTFSVLFDSLQILVSAAFGGVGLALTVLSLGIFSFVTAPLVTAAVIINKAIQIQAMIFFFFVYLFLLQHKTKLRLRRFIKKALLRAGIAYLVESLPFAGFLPMITVSNILIIHTFDVYDKKRRELFTTQSARQSTVV